MRDQFRWNGVDLESFTGLRVLDLSGLVAPATRRGSHDTIPGRAGDLGAQLPLAAYNFAVPVYLEQPTHAARLALLRTVTNALLAAGGLGTLEWRQDDGAGGLTPVTAAGAFNALNGFELLALQSAKTELSFTNLDGAWKTAGGATVLV